MPRTKSKNKSTKRKYHPLYGSWSNMRRCCYQENSREYATTGAQGIKVYWDKFLDFAAWVEDNLGPRPAPGIKLGRIDHDRDYEPGNLRWSTPKEVGNRCRNNVRMKYKKKTQTIKQWAEEYGVNYHTFRDRMNRNWKLKDALTAGIWEIKHQNGKKKKTNTTDR